MYPAVGRELGSALKGLIHAFVELVANILKGKFDGAEPQSPKVEHGCATKVFELGAAGWVVPVMVQCGSCVPPASTTLELFTPVPKMLTCAAERGKIDKKQ